MERVGAGVARTLAMIGIVVSTVWGIWFAGAALVGGSVWVPGGHVVFAEGSILMALLMFFIGIPVLDTLVYWLTMGVVFVVTLPFAATAGARSGSRSRKCSPEARLVDLGNGVGVEFTKKPEGGATWRYLGLQGEPHFMMHITAQRVLTQQQLAAGEEPWFADVAQDLARERQDAEGKHDTGALGEDGR